jgi:hypothetical protein
MTPRHVRCRLEVGSKFHPKRKLGPACLQNDAPAALTPTPVDRTTVKMLGARYYTRPGGSRWGGADPDLSNLGYVSHHAEQRFTNPSTEAVQGERAKFGPELAQIPKAF